MRGAALLVRTSACSPLTDPWLPLAWVAQNRALGQRWVRAGWTHSPATTCRHHQRLNEESDHVRGQRRRCCEETSSTLASASQLLLLAWVTHTSSLAALGAGVAHDQQ